MHITPFRAGSAGFAAEGAGPQARATCGTHTLSQGGLAPSTLTTPAQQRQAAVLGEESLPISGALDGLLLASLPSG